MSRRLGGAYTHDVHPDKPWPGVLFALIDECPSDRPVHFRAWQPIFNIFVGQMYRWEVRWYEKGTEP